MKERILFLIMLLCSLSSRGQETSYATIDSLIFSAQYEPASQLISQTLAKTNDRDQQALLLNKAAEVQILQGKLDNAETRLKAIPSTTNQFITAVTETNLGFLYINKARNDQALNYLQSALTKFQESGNRNTRESARCLAYLTTLFWSTGKLNQAEENGLVALQIREALYGENSEAVAASLNDLGLIYSQSDPDKALSYYEKALVIYQKVHGKDHPKIAIASNNIGAMYRQLELYGDAVNNFETALAIWKKIYPNGHPNQAAALVNLGRTYVKMGDRKTALGFFEKAVVMYRQSYGNKHPDISAVLNQVALLQIDDQQFKAGLTSLQEALIANAPDFNKKDIARNPKADDYYNGKVLLYSMRLKAEALESKHYGKTLKLTDLTAAISCLYTCDTLIDHIRHHSTDENDKIELGESANEVYEDGVRIAQALSEISLANRHFREVAFYFAEKSKSAVLQESIADAAAKSYAGIPDELVSQENNLKSTIAFLAQKLSQKPPVEEEKYLREALFSSNLEYNAFIKKLETDYPNYFNLKFNQSAPTVPQLQTILNPNTAIVSYFIADKGKRIYQFVITRKSFSIANLTLPETFDKFVRALNNSVLFNDVSTYNQVSSSLSKTLVPSLSRDITELIIIPSGRLGTIPFEVLFYRKNKSSQYADMPLLLKKYAIGYEFSAGLLPQKSKSRQLHGDASIFLCAPVQFPDKDNLDDLPGTETEVNGIASLFTGKETGIAKFSDANEDMIKSGTLTKFNYLHFATHGIVDQTDPELSRIFLQSGKQDDGNLYSGEIYNIKLNADLTVLSACQTGLGKFSKGEGVIGLSRALVYAGSKNIIVSFWSVADESTSQLMTQFYKILLSKKDQDFRQTLQQAKLAMIRDGKYTAPYYWAPFILIGY